MRTRHGGSGNRTVPETQVTIGPAIENGFYYDFYREKPFTEGDLETIETKMHEIIDRGDPFEREVWARDEAMSHYEKIKEPFKVELIEGIPDDEPISFYRQGNFLDLCRGPHAPSTKHVGHAFKLMSVAGAYWRGTRQTQCCSEFTVQLGQMKKS